MNLVLPVNRRLKVICLWAYARLAGASYPAYPLSAVKRECLRCYSITMYPEERAFLLPPKCSS